MNKRLEEIDMQLFDLQAIKDELLKQIKDVDLEIEKLENQKKNLKVKSVAYSREDAEKSKDETPF